MLHGVGEIDLAAGQPGVNEGLIEEVAGRADKGRTLLILVITGLFANQHYWRFSRAGAEDRLGGGQIEIAALTTGGGGAKTRDRTLGGQELGGGTRFGLLFCCHVGTIAERDFKAP